MSGTIHFLFGLAVLLASGHLVVEVASRVGRRFGLSPMVVGLTVVAAGTSAPELAVVGQAVAAEDTELAVGSVIGSNIANVLLVLGLAAAFGAIRVTSRVVRIDIPVMIAASVALRVLAGDGALSRLDGLLMVGALVVFVAWTIAATRADTTDAASASPLDVKRAMDRIDTLPRMFGTLSVGIVGLAIAARFVVSGAEDLAVALGMPELIIGLTIVALGTSAPEIATTVIAALRGQRDMAVGNAVGSNIFNILLVFGATTVFAPDGLRFGADAIELDLPILVAAAVACLPMVFFDHRLNRWEGALFVAYYFAYLAFLVLDATGHHAKDPFLLVMWAFVVPLTLVTIGVILARRHRRRVASVSAARQQEPVHI